MATIGTFTSTENGFTGSIRTLALNVKARIARVENPSDKGPQFRVYAGSVELGAAWQKTSEQGRDSGVIALTYENEDPILARQVLEGVLAGEGSPREVVDARGLAVVSDDGALIAAIDEALAAQPDVLAKIQDGKVQAAGAVIGAVMKAMGGQADAKRVRELILERAQA